jgi:hypothetical protein
VKLTNKTTKLTSKTANKKQMIAEFF